MENTMSAETRNADARFRERMRRARTDEMRAKLGLPAYAWSKPIRESERA